jgi:transposase
LPTGTASPADQAAEIARLRRELDRTRMERDILKNRRGLGPPVGSETACW